MYKLGILTRHAELYASLIQQAKLPQLDIVFAQEHEHDLADLSQLDILLAEPKLAAKILLQCTNLQWLQSTWAGNKPLFDLAKQDYVLTGVKDVFKGAMAEYVFAYILYFSRNIAAFKQQQTRAVWQAPAYSSLQGKTLGIIGVGNIGQAVAKTAKSFSMQVRGLTHSSRGCDFVDKYFSWAELPQFCHGVDYLLCLLPHTQATEGAIDQQLLSLLPPHCVLINAGRGQTIVEDDLTAALQQQLIKAAVLDVFDTEPLPQTHPFWTMDNVFITNHTAAESQPQDIAQIFLQNFNLFRHKQSLLGQLDFFKSY